MFVIGKLLSYSGLSRIMRSLAIAILANYRNNIKWSR
tara:strand:- start:11800 stop:11910 length:111 start_codon:yes stop_codon:yes gene_type:complete